MQRVLLRISAFPADCMRSLLPEPKPSVCYGTGCRSPKAVERRSISGANRKHGAPQPDFRSAPEAVVAVPDVSGETASRQHGRDPAHTPEAEMLAPLMAIGCEKYDQSDPNDPEERVEPHHR